MILALSLGGQLVMSLATSGFNAWVDDTDIQWMKNKNAGNHSTMHEAGEFWRGINL